MRYICADMKRLNDCRISLDAAFKSLGTNRLRTGLTVAIIAVGIMSLVSIQTALAIMTEKVAGSFSKMGADVFTVTSQDAGAPISLRQARLFKESAPEGMFAAVGLSLERGSLLQAKYASAVTDPLVTLVEADENYLTLAQGAVAEGRMFSASEAASRSAVAVIGDNVRRKLFSASDGTSPVGETILASGRHFKVTGVIERQGSMLGNGLDNSIITPICADGDFCITLIPAPGVAPSDALEAARARLSAIRRLAPGADADFIIARADSLQDKLSSIRTKLSLAALVIGLITLLGSAVGLMNIMLVTVKERTREIGIRKAIGAGRSQISLQFLSEAVVIGQIGGCAGIILGVLSGNLVGIIMEGTFTLLWGWIIASVLICLAVSILSGVIPARRAASLDPIEALR